MGGRGQKRPEPRFDLIGPADVKPAVTSIIERLEADFATLEKSLEAQEPTTMTYADVVEELEKLEAPVEYAWGVVGHLMGVKNGDELRASHGEMQPVVIQATTKLSQSLAIYKALEAVMAADPSLDGAQKRVLLSSLQSMKLSGVALEGEQKEAFNANRMELADLSTKFSNHVRAAIPRRGGWPGRPRGGLRRPGLTRPPAARGRSRLSSRLDPQQHPL